MTLHRLTIKILVGIHLVLHSVKSKGCVVDTVTETADHTSKEAVSLLKGFYVTISDYNVLYLAIAVRHTDADDAASVIC